MKNYYEILGVSRDASKEDIREVYRKLVHIYHPDKGGNEWKFKEINEAYNTLSDNGKRVEYDERYDQSNQNNQPSARYQESVPESSVPEKIYEAINKIKSSKWNAFFLTDSEVEEYLSDGVYIEDMSFFSKFSKKRREDNIRREKRTNSLVNQRIVTISKEYLKRNTIPLEKEIIAAIIEPTKNLFNQKVSHIWKASFGNDDLLQRRLQELIEDGKKESGDIVACFPLKDEGWSGKILLFTTKGISFVVLREGDERLALTLGLGQSLGLIGFGLGHIASVFINKHKMSTCQQKLIELATICSPSLLVQCLPGSQYIPYEMINLFTYFDENKESNNSQISLIYANSQQEFHKVDRSVMLEIIKILSGYSPPKK
jgi:curved DNA-binding protein CbpA